MIFTIALALGLAGCASPIMRRSTCDFEVNLARTVRSIKQDQDEYELAMCKIIRDGIRQEADDCESALFQEIKK